jgi:Flp pilus assembly protein TadD
MEKGIIQHDRKQFAYALKTFQQAFLIKKNDPEIFLWISKCYAGLGEKEQAEDWKKKYEALK